MPSTTEKGLFFLLIAQVLGILGGLFSFMVLMAIADAYVNASKGTVTTTAAAYAEAGALLTVLGLAGLAGLVLTVIGLVFMFQGKDEWGAGHASKCMLGLILIIVGAVANSLGVYVFSWEMVNFAHLGGTVVSCIGSFVLIVALVKESEKKFGVLAIVLTLAGSVFLYLLFYTLVIAAAMGMIGALILIVGGICQLVYYSKAYANVKSGNVGGGSGFGGYGGAYGGGGYQQSGYGGSQGGFGGYGGNQGGQGGWR